MQFNENKIYTKISAAAVYSIQESVKKYLPSSTQKEFMLWILSNTNRFQNDYLKMLGVSSSIKLEIAMLNKIVNDNDIFEKLLPYLGFLNAYFAFETIQDNMAIGLAKWHPAHNSTNAALQKKLLSHFNPIMIRKLQGNSEPAAAALAPYATIAEKISAYERCLSPFKMFEFASEFETYNNKSLLFELDHCFYPILILNIETANDLLNSLPQNRLYPFLQESLIARYASVDKLLKTPITAPLKLADLGAKSILVLPTIIYYIGALDTVFKNPLLTKSIIDSSLNHAIYSCALLVRLLNDIGPNLLILNKSQQDNFFKTLQQFSQEQKFNSFIELLSAVSETAESNNLMVRIAKDIKYGEFNICLDNLTDIHDITLALNEFCDNIRFYSQLYRQYCKTLLTVCDNLEKKLQDTKISQFILNMFKFHEQMYSLTFENVLGDYAILSKEETK